MATSLMLSTRSNKTMNEKVLLEVSEYLSKKHSPFPFQQSSAGKTGITFLPMHYQFEWVVKWQNRPLTEVEYLCTQFYKRAFEHLSVPEVIYEMPIQLREELNRFFKKQNISSQYLPMLMQYKNGNNLNKLCENKNLFSLCTKELHKLFSCFGEISGYDFLIANSDRFIPSRFCGTIDERHAANGGNILIELNVPLFFDEEPVQPSLKGVHLIDNTPHSLSFFDYSERKIEDLPNDPSSHMLDLGSIFGNEDQKQEAQVIMAVVKTTDVEVGNEKRDKRHHDFVYFMQANSVQLERLAKQIALGIKNEWKRSVINLQNEIDKFYDVNINVIMEGLFTGLSAAQHNITNPHLQQILDDLKTEAASFTKSAQVMLDFIQKNLIFTQKIKHKL